MASDGHEFTLPGTTINFSALSSDSYHPTKSAKTRGFGFSLSQPLTSWRRVRYFAISVLFSSESINMTVIYQTRSLTLTFLSRECLRKGKKQEKHIFYLGTPEPNVSFIYMTTLSGCVFH